MSVLNLGHGAFTPMDRVCWVASSNGSKMKKLVQAKEAAALLVNVTSGHQAASLVGLSSREVIVSSVSVKALKKRFLKTSAIAESKGEES